EYALPAAVLQLRQGFGRLIRSHQDRGVVAILDPRLRTRAYGRAFLESLPSSPVTSDPAAVAGFFGAGAGVGAIGGEAADLRRGGVAGLGSASPGVGAIGGEAADLRRGGVAGLGSASPGVGAIGGEAADLRRGGVAGLGSASPVSGH